MLVNSQLNTSQKPEAQVAKQVNSILASIRRSVSSRTRISSFDETVPQTLRLDLGLDYKKNHELLEHV